MIKKKLNILLLLSLALLFIGSFSTSYARELSTDEINNMIRNYYENTTSSTARVPVEEFIEYNMNNGHIPRIAQVTSDLPTQYVIGISYNTLFIWYTWSGSSTGTTNRKPYISNGTLNSNTSYMGNAQFRLNFSDKTIWQNYNNTSSPSFYNISSEAYYYSAYNIYNGYNGSQIIIPANTYYPNDSIFDNSSYFTFDFNSNLSTNVSVQNLDDPSSLVLVPWNSSSVLNGSIINLGTLYNLSNLDYIRKEIWRFDTRTQTWVLKRFQDISSFSGDNFNIDGEYLFVNEKTSNYADNIEHLVFVPKDSSQFDSVLVSFYWQSPYTKIENGVVNIINTFSGDYLIVSNNDDNTDKIIDNINDFNSGDLDSLIDFGEMPQLDDPTSNLLSYLLNRISTVFLGDYTASYVDIPFYDNIVYRVYASWFDFFPVELKTIVGILTSIMIIKRFFPKIHDFVSAVQTAQVGHLAEKIQGGLSVVDIL